MKLRRKEICWNVGAASIYYAILKEQAIRNVCLFF